MHRTPGWLMAAFDATIRPLLWDPCKIVGPHLEPGRAVADIGCGAGYYAPALSSLIGADGELFLVDVQEDMLERAMKRVGSDPQAEAQVAPVLTDGDSFDLPRRVDFALMSWMLHEVERPELLWRSVHEHLRPGGQALVIEPRVHVRRRKFDEEMAPAADLGFRVERTNGIFFCRVCVATKPERTTERDQS